jgi:uncharacterized membrane protein required for colicin V production
MFHFLLPEDFLFQWFFGEVFANLARILSAALAARFEKIMGKPAELRFSNKLNPNWFQPI